MAASYRHWCTDLVVKNRKLCTSGDPRKSRGAESYLLQSSRSLGTQGLTQHCRGHSKAGKGEQRSTAKTHRKVVLAQVASNTATSIRSTGATSGHMLSLGHIWQRAAAASQSYSQCASCSRLGGKGGLSTDIRSLNKGLVVRSLSWLPTATACCLARRSGALERATSTALGARRATWAMLM